MDLAFLDEKKIATECERVSARVMGAARSGRLAIVGSAALPQKCLKSLRVIGGDVRAFIEYDARFWGKTVDGVPVLSPDEALRLLDHNAVVVCGVWSPNHSYKDTRDWVAAFGFKTVYPAAAIFWAIPNVIGQHYQLDAPHGLAKKRAEAEKLLFMLADDESRHQLIGNLKWRVTLDPSHIPIPDRRHVYFDPRLFALDDAATIVDVGAFDGNSLRSFLLWRGKNFRRFYALEPDPLSFARLTDYLHSLPQDLAGKIEIAQIAAGSSEGQIEVLASGKPGSGGLGSTGEVSKVRCVRLTDYFAEMPIDYIKLDIEGAEWAALDGAWPIIREKRPIIGIAAYHKPTDLIDLPLRIMEHLPDASCFFRSHDDDGIDFVFYAVPNERRRKLRT